MILHCKQKHLGVSNINVIYTAINTRANYKRVIILFLVDGNKVIQTLFNDTEEEFHLLQV